MSDPNQPYQPFQQPPWPPAPQQHSTVPPAPVSPPPFQPETGTVYPPPKRRRRGRTALIIVGAALGVCLVSSIVGAALSGGDKPSTTTAAATSHATPSRSPAAPTPTPAASKPPTKPATTQAPAKPKPITYKKITDRQWKLIAKNPDAYVGKAYVVYGEVTQFDAATGTDTFRADVGGAQRRPSYGFVDYPTNTVLTGDEGKLSKLVEGDLFRAEVLVGGSLDYDTQIGGQTTVPALIISTIKVTGSVA